MMLSPSRRGGPIGKKNGAPVRKKSWFVMLLRSRDGRVRIFKRGLNQPFHASFGVVCDGWGVSSGGARSETEKLVPPRRPTEIEKQSSRSEKGLVCDAFAVSRWQGETFQIQKTTICRNLRALCYVATLF